MPKREVTKEMGVAWLRAMRVAAEEHSTMAGRVPLWGLIEDINSILRHLQMNPIWGPHSVTVEVEEAGDDKS